MINGCFSKIGSLKSFVRRLPLPQSPHVVNIELNIFTNMRCAGCERHDVDAETNRLL
jgi:hypothetical protein